MQQEITQNSCQMLGIFGVIVQILLGILSFSVLIFKRQHEYPKRPWKIWALDTSKQGVSQLIAHFINIAISLLLSFHLANDACFWYFTTNVLDNTFGVFICVGVLQLVETKIMNKKYQHLKSGNYFKVKEVLEQDFTSTTNRSSQLTNGFQIQSLQICRTKKKININYLAWLLQFLIWNLIVVICKTLLLFLELLLNRPLNAITQFLLGWVQQYPALQLVLVIIIVPVFMNGLAFWIQDNFLKKRFTAEEILSKQTLL